MLKKEPFKPPEYSSADVYAVQALRRGNASPEQQRHAVDLIINGIACAFDQSYRPGKPDETTFAEGKRFVGLQVYRLAHMNPATVENIYGRTDDDDSRPQGE